MGTKEYAGFCKGGCGRILTIAQLQSPLKLCERCLTEKTQHARDFHIKYDITKEEKDA